MSKKHPKQPDQDRTGQDRPANQPKILVITPQIPVAIHGEFPNQWLTVEDPTSPGYRKKITLTQENCYGELFAILQAKAGEIELERQLIIERKTRAAKPKAQPDWITIAVHPEAVIIERLPTTSRALSGTKSEFNLEDMGL